MNNSNKWILDSGATSSMTWNKNIFSEYKPVTGEFIISASGHRLPISGKGTVQLDIISGNDPITLSLTHVLYVPESKVQLLSVRALGRQGFSTKFTQDAAMIISETTEQVLFEIKSMNSHELYEFTPISTHCNLALSITQKTELKVSFIEAHEILRHVNYRTLKELIMRKKIKGLRIIGKMKALDCETCKIVKSTVKPHDSTAERHAEFPGHIVSGDVIDCRSIPNIGNFKFISVLVDQYTYYTSVRILKTKTAESILAHIQDFNTGLQNYANAHIKIFRSDRGLEYKNQLLQTYARTNNISLELGVANEPRDNGFAERRNRTLVEATHAVIHSSGFEPPGSSL